MFEGESIKEPESIKTEEPEGHEMVSKACGLLFVRSFHEICNTGKLSFAIVWKMEGTCPCCHSHGLMKP